jgi:hypothetical protein
MENIAWKNFISSSLLDWCQIDVVGVLVDQRCQCGIDLGIALDVFDM